MNSINPILPTSFNPFSLFSKTPQEKLESILSKKKAKRFDHLYEAFKLNQDIKAIKEQIHWLDTLSSDPSISEGKKS